jgi:hypothetical protein
LSSSLLASPAKLFGACLWALVVGDGIQSGLKNGHRAASVENSVKSLVLLLSDSQSN